MNGRPAWVMGELPALRAKRYGPGSRGPPVPTYPKKLLGRVVLSSAPKPTTLGLSPRYCPSGDGDSMRVIRGSTTPPNCVPFIRPSTNWVCRQFVTLFLLRPQKL